jgi:hypothetical protein
MGSLESMDLQAPWLIQVGHRRYNVRETFGYRPLGLSFERMHADIIKHEHARF